MRSALDEFLRAHAEEINDELETICDARLVVIRGLETACDERLALIEQLQAEIDRPKTSSPST